MQKITVSSSICILNQIDIRKLLQKIQLDTSLQSLRRLKMEKW